jgi:DNA-binding beta-propeller fold protein YncE
MNRLAWVLLAAAIWVSSAFGAEVGLSAKPRVERAGAAVKIGFALSQAADVEVAVLNERDQVVRHLAAGVLGGANPPPAPLQPGLTQELTWDNLDDFGRPVAGAVRVRVRAGMSVAFEAFVGDSPYALNRIRGMAVDKEGRLYVLEQSYDGHFPGPYDLRVFDRTGTYLRTLMPFGAGMSKADAAPFAAIDLPNGASVPRNQYSVWPCLIPIDPLRGLKLSASVTADGTLLLHDETFATLFRLRTKDGTTPDASFGVSLWPRTAKLPYYDRGGSPVFALAPDGKTLYAVGFAAAAPKGQKVNVDWPDGRVYRFALDRLGQGAEPFATVALPEKTTGVEAGWTPDTARCALQGLAVDGHGRVYVCDSANGLVRQFSPDGKELGAARVPNAYQCAVDDRSGAVYVVTCAVPGRAGEKKLVKLATLGGAPAAVLDLGGAASAPCLAADFGAEKPVLWVSGAGPRAGLLRVVDDGDKLTIAETLTDRDPFALRAVDKMAVDPATDDLYVNDGWSGTVRLNGLTGAVTSPVVDGWPRPLVVTDTTVSPDGFVYVQQGPSYSGRIQRLTRDLKPAPLAATGSDLIANVYGRYGAGFCEKGHVVGFDGRLYSLGMYDWAKYFVCVYDAQGKAMPGPRLAGLVKAREPVSAGVTSGLIGPLPARCGGMKVDRAGCLYIGMQHLPLDHKRPAGFENDQAYTQMVGSVVKFSPAGGGIAQAKGEGILSLRGVDLEGALAVYPDLASISGWRRSDGCVCRTPRFDLDLYGRLYIPNTITYTVKIVDNAGNEVLSFGRYGNLDARGTGTDVPLGWPLSVGASETRLYVGDMFNRRVVRLLPKFAAEEIVTLK